MAMAKRCLQFATTSVGVKIIPINFVRGLSVTAVHQNYPRIKGIRENLRGKENLTPITAINGNLFARKASTETIQIAKEENKQLWEKRFEENSTRWHIEEVEPMLLKHLPKLLKDEHKDMNTGQVVQQRKPKILIPLCGMSKDIPFLMHQGFEVVAIELVKSPIERLQRENSISLKFDHAENVYQNEEQTLKIYIGDILDCPIERFGPIDYIWDRASFIALNYPLRQGYVDVLKRSVALGSGHEFRYLLETVRYDTSKFTGPPFSVSAQDVQDYFGSWANVEQVDEVKIRKNHPLHLVFENYEGEGEEIIYLLTNKKSA